MFGLAVCNFCSNFKNCTKSKRFFLRKCWNYFIISRKSILFSSQKMELESGDTQNVTESNETVTIKENTTEILEPPGKRVFYNPVQEFNRDLSVLVLQYFSKQFLNQKNDSTTDGSQKPFRILEALSATGLRSIRYAKEVPNVTEVIANDFSLAAVNSIKDNIKHNNVESIVKPNQADASAFMANSIQSGSKFHVVDLDPYGSPVQFLDLAVQCVEDGGMLLVTCTDTMILCGLYPETCYAKYGALPLRHPAKHEMAIRIVLQCIQSHASRYKRYIVPVLSVSVDFYIRVFVKVYTSAAACKAVVSKLSMVYQCRECYNTILQTLGVEYKKEVYSLPSLPEIGGKCKHCGGNQEMGGPIWSAPIHDKTFITEMMQSSEMQNFNTSKRILGMLTMIQEELDTPLYYLTPDFGKIFRVCQMPLLTLRSAILNAGYKVSDSHASQQSVKTDAPMGFMLDVHKSWMKENNIKPTNLTPGSQKILDTPIEHKIDLSERPDAKPPSREMGLCRYQLNPPYWGPGVKSKTMSLQEKQRPKDQVDKDSHTGAKKPRKRKWRAKTKE